MNDFTKDNKKIELKKRFGISGIPLLSLQGYYAAQIAVMFSSASCDYHE